MSALPYMMYVSDVLKEKFPDKDKESILKEISKHPAFFAASKLYQSGEISEANRVIVRLVLQGT